MIKIKNKISKETFKRFFGECPKLALALDNFQNFTKTISLKKNKVISIFNTSNNFEDDEDFDVESPIDPFEEYISFLSKGNLNKEETKKIVTLKEKFENIDGLVEDELRSKISDDMSDINKKYIKQKDKIELIKKAFYVEDGFSFETFQPQSIMDGNMFGEEVRNYFIEKCEIDNIDSKTVFKTLDLSMYNFEAARLKTIEALQDKNIKYIFEAAFSYDNDKLKTRCDVLEKNEKNEFTIFEAKATTSVKKEHIFDVAYQKFVLMLNKINVKEIKICNLNPIFVRNQKGRENVFDMNRYKVYLEEEDLKIEFSSVEKILNDKNLDNLKDEEIVDLDYQWLVTINEYFCDTKKSENWNMYEVQKTHKRIDEWVDLILNSEEFEDFLSELDSLLGIDNESKEFKDMLLSLNYDLFKITFKIKNLTVENKYCKHIGKYFDKNQLSIFDFNRLSKSTAFRAWDQTKKVYLKDIDIIEDEEFYLTNNKGILAEKHPFGSIAPFVFPIFKKYIDFNKIEDYECVVEDNFFALQKTIKSYQKFPIYMYDFETSTWAVPKFNNQTPYLQTPFQYSIDVLTDDKYNWKDPSTMKHYEFLAKTQTDPRREFIRHFITDSFKHGPGTYVAYNKSFECMVLRGLAAFYPEYRDALLYIAQNTIDLMDFFKQNKIPAIIFHPDFRNSFSIKVTQPVLDSSLSYKELNINKGDKASYMYRIFADDKLSINPSVSSLQLWKEIYYPDMIDYCNRDTLAMVVVLQRAIEIYNSYMEWKKQEK